MAGLTTSYLRWKEAVAVKGASRGGRGAAREEESRGCQASERSTLPKGGDAGTATGCQLQNVRLDLGSKL